MSNGYWGPPVVVEMPGTVKAARVLMYIAGGLSAVLAVLLAVVYGGNEGVGAALVQGVPAVVSLVMAARLRNGRNGMRWGVVGLQGVWIWFALSRLGADQDPTGVIGLALPIATIVLVNVASARQYFGRAR